MEQVGLGVEANGRRTCMIAGLEAGPEACHRRREKYSEPGIR